MNKLETKQYTHTLVEMECLIESHTIKKQTLRMKLPSTNNWDQNLASILSRIPIKFPIIADMKDNEWCLTLNDDNIINKHNSTEFGKLLSTIKPPAILKIIYSINCNILIIQFNNKTFKWIPPNSNSNDKNIWDQNYNKLLNKINMKYKLNKNDYDLQDIEQCEIECGIDLMSIWQALKNDNQITIAKISVLPRDINTETNDLINNIPEEQIVDLQSILQHEEAKSKENASVNVMDRHKNEEEKLEKIYANSHLKYLPLHAYS
eukprot:138505_1